MSRAYAARATGDILWQVDSDEFYHMVKPSKLCELYFKRSRRFIC